MARKLLQTAAAKRRRALYRAKKKKGAGFADMWKKFKYKQPQHSRHWYYLQGVEKRRKEKERKRLAEIDAGIKSGKYKPASAAMQKLLNRPDPLAGVSRGRAVIPAAAAHGRKQLDKAAKALTSVKRGSGFSKGALKQIAATIRQIKRRRWGVK